MAIKKTVPFLINAGKLRILISANNKNKYNPQEPNYWFKSIINSANNKNKYNPQEHLFQNFLVMKCANNKNKYNPQEPRLLVFRHHRRANNKNKYNPQEQEFIRIGCLSVQIIRINTILKNWKCFSRCHVQCK